MFNLEIWIENHVFKIITQSQSVYSVHVTYPDMNINHKRCNGHFENRIKTQIYYTQIFKYV